MKKLVIARHGDYDGSLNLDSSGRTQIKSLAERLRPIVGEDSLLILSSVAARAVQSAEIIAESFGTTIEQHEVLWSENRHPVNLPAALDLIKSRGEEADVVVMLTHLEYSERFPQYFGYQVLDANLLPYKIEKGNALVIDCEARTLYFV